MGSRALGPGPQTQGAPSCLGPWARAWDLAFAAITEMWFPLPPQSQWNRYSKGWELLVLMTSGPGNNTREQVAGWVCLH